MSSHASRQTRCIPLTCPPLAAEMNAAGITVGAWSPPRTLEYRETVKLKCQGCNSFVPFQNFTTPRADERECAWTCQYSEARGSCLPKRCMTSPPDGTQWLGSPPSECGSAAGTLRCAQLGHVFDLSKCLPDETYLCSNANVGGSSEAGPEMALLDHALKSCIPARCSWSVLEQLTQNASQNAQLLATDIIIGNSTQFGALAAIQCKLGFRARNKTALVPVLRDDSATFNVTCGMAHSACSWNIAHGCFPVQCRVWPSTNGAQLAVPVSPGLYQLQGATYVDRETVVTIKCDNGYRATPSPLVSWDSLHDSTLEYSIAINGSAERVTVSCSKTNCSCSDDGELGPIFPRQLCLSCWLLTP